MEGRDKMEVEVQWCSLFYYIKYLNFTKIDNKKKENITKTCGKMSLQ